MTGPRPTDYLRTKLQQLLPKHPGFALIHVTDHTDLNEVRAWLRRRDETDLKSLTVSRELVRESIRTGDDSALMNALESELRRKGA